MPLQPPDSYQTIATSAIFGRILIKLEGRADCFCKPLSFGFVQALLACFCLFSNLTACLTGVPSEAPPERRMAEEEGFEPPVSLRPRLISSQVP
jgi:hypothetical protein